MTVSAHAYDQIECFLHTSYSAHARVSFILQISPDIVCFADTVFDITIYHNVMYIYIYTHMCVVWYAGASWGAVEVEDRDVPKAHTEQNTHMYEFKGSSET